MQVAFKNGDVIVAGVVVNPKFSKVGEKGTSRIAFGVLVGTNPDTTKVFANCVAWRELAEALSGLERGDSIMCVGKIEKREYQGKEYTDLVCDWAWSPNLVLRASGAMPTAPTAAGVPAFVEVADGDEDPFGDSLPF